MCYPDFKPTHGSQFIDLSIPVQNIALFILNRKDGINEVHQIDAARKKRGVKLEDLKGPLFRNYFQILPPEIEPEYQKLAKNINSFVGSILYERQGQKCTVSELVTLVSKQYKIEAKLADAFLKLMKANHIIKLKSNKAKKSFYSMEYHSIRCEGKIRYLASIMSEVTGIKDRITFLISHGPTQGSYYEGLIRSVLKKYIPSKYHVATGFIEDCPNQIDILIYDRMNYPPIFQYEDLVVVGRDSVRAVIEVKSRLDSTSINEALQHIYEIFMEPNHHTCLPIFKGIIALDSTRKTNATSFKDFIKFYRTNGRETKYLFQEITCVCVPQKICVYTEYVTASHEGVSNPVPIVQSVRSKTNRDVQSAIFVMKLLKYFDLDVNGSGYDFDNMLESYTPQVEIDNEDFLHGTGWKPKWDLGRLSYQIHLYDIYKWFANEIDSQEIKNKCR